MLDPRRDSSIASVSRSPSLLVARPTFEKGLRGVPSVELLRARLVPRLRFMRWLAELSNGETSVKARLGKSLRAAGMAPNNLRWHL
jgi:hypothetical protein